MQFQVPKLLQKRVYESNSIETNEVFTWTLSDANLFKEVYFKLLKRGPLGKEKKRNSVTAWYRNLENTARVCSARNPSLILSCNSTQFTFSLA